MKLRLAICIGWSNKPILAAVLIFKLRSFFTFFLGIRDNSVVPTLQSLRLLFVNSDKPLSPNKCCNLNPGLGRLARIFLILIGRLNKTENPADNRNIAPPPSP